MELEYEVDQVLEEEESKLWNYCPSCGTLIIGNFCNNCKKTVPTERYVDPEFDAYFDSVEDEGRELNKELKDESQWVSVE